MMMRGQGEMADWDRLRTIDSCEDGLKTVCFSSFHISYEVKHECSMLKLLENRRMQSS